MMCSPGQISTARLRLKTWRAVWFVGVLLAAINVAAAGEVTPRLFLGQNTMGQLEVFKLDDAGRLCYRWRKASNGSWSTWCSLGGALSRGVSIVNNADGEMIVFGVDRTNGAVVYITQLTTNSLDWSSWAQLGGNFEGPPVAAKNADGRLEVFTVDAVTHHVKHVWETAPGQWSGWADLGGPVQPGLVAASNEDGRLELFGLARNDGSLLHCWQIEANTKSDWSDWVGLGRPVQPGFTVAHDKVGRLEFFTVNPTNGEVFRICEWAPNESTNWTAWQSFGGNVEPELAVGQCGVGRLEVFAVNVTNAMLLHRWEVHTNTSDEWSDWAELGEKCAGRPAVAADADGDLEVFAPDPANPDLIHHRRQFSYANSWLDWSSLDRPALGWLPRLWQVDEGLPNNLVQAITQTRDGFLWVGTRAGLARFDGSQFLCYDSQNTPQLKNPSITALCAGQDGALWIGTDGGGLLRLKNGIFSQFSRSNGMAGDAVQVIFEGRDGTIWVGTSSGMSRFQNGVFHNYSTRDGLLSDVVRCIYEDRDGNLWIATGKGLNRLAPNGTMDAFDMPNGLPNDSVRAITEDRGGRIWIGSNNGLLWYEWYWKISFYAYNTKYGLSDPFVSAICEDGDANLWVGTYSGLNRFQDGWFYSQPDGDGQAFDKVNALFVDRQGDLWVGSKDGLSRLTRRIFFTYTKQQGLTHNNVMSVLQNDSGGMWIGTWGGGLNELENEKVTAYASTNGLSEDLILSLCAGRDGSLWAGADFDGGLTRLKNGHMTHYTWQDGLIKAGLRVLHEDPAGNLWIGTDSGLSCFKDGQFITNRITERLAGVSIRDICEGGAGALWMATQNGLYYCQGRRVTVFSKADGLSDNSLNALFMDAEGTLWIGTSAGGLIRYRNGSFTAYTERQGLFSDEIFGIVEDDGGWLWLSCSKGIFRLQKKDLAAFDRGELGTINCLVYGKNDGMESPQCNGNGKPSAWKSRDGRLWFPTSKGLVAVDPKAVGVQSEPLAVFIETVVADAKTVEGGQTNLAGAATVLASRSAPLRVPPGHGELEFQYTVLDLAAPEKARFEYRLDGVDAGWIEAGGRRIAYYNNLAPGSYVFHVKASSLGGDWSAVVSMGVILRPHYWQTVWFRGLMTCAVIGGAIGVALYATRKRMQRKLVRLEQQQAVEKERGRIAKDMHDQIGAGLTHIGLLGEFARRDAVKNRNVNPHVEKICDMARELARTLDEIVWMVNPKNDTLNKLGIYLAAYAEEFFQATDIRWRLDIPPNLPAYPIPTEVRHNLFLTVQEALNNIAKHSQASEAKLSFVLNDSVVEIAIEDDGIGFSVAGANAARYGISNMQERLKAIGGAFEISSGLQKGTRICLRVPLKEMGDPNG